MRSLLLAVAIAALFIPSAAAQHEGMMGGEGMAMVLHDGPDSGRAVVGAVTHLGFALLDAKGAPVVHQNAQLLVTLDNATLFNTTDTHEYDGIFSLDLLFPHPGHYRVEAMSGKMMMGVFEGDAVAPMNATVAKVVIKPQPSMAPVNVVDLILDIQGPDGKTIPHTDAILEWRSKSSGALAARYHAHIHEEPIKLTQGFDAPGDYVLHATAYKAFGTGRSTDVAAVVGEAAVTVGALAQPSVPDPAGIPTSKDQVLNPAGATATSDGLTLHGMYDPQNQVAMGFPIRFSALVEGNDSMPKPHVDFAFELHGPRGQVFSSKSLHEYDGHFEYLYVPQAPGAYDATLIASDGKAHVSVPFHVQVLPPATPLGLASMGGVGQGTIEIKGLDKIVAGEPANLTFSVMGPSGPIQHSEVDVTIAQKGGPALYNFKLHTHDSGLTNAIVVFPADGDYTVQVDPLPTDPEPVVFQGPAGAGQPIVFHAKVPAGHVTSASLATPGAPAEKRAPGPTLGLMLVGLGAAALRRRA
jgi:hypothetical protein